ncbi:unnamed protein product [Cylicocyclus nassatus]|uniref:Uncharacterized protein n=1 Tax=Cylicocyclus nassatus TaxID=53992 RepID=A0AA36DUF6_CYLNA|nr:unnamed protein product [Cylicocyclus nassatus]
MDKLEYIYSKSDIDKMKADAEKKEILDGYRAHIKDVRNYGNVFGEKAVGGILGYASNAQLDATVDNTYYSYVISNNSQVNGYDYVGGLVGQIGSNIHINKAFNSNESAAGASNNYGTTSSTGNSIITGNAESIKEQIKDTSTYGQVKGHNYVGGLIGGSTADSKDNKINNAYNAANVIATGDYVGGIAGYFSGAGSSITNAYNGDNNTIIRELFPIMDGDGAGVSQGKNDIGTAIKNLDDLLNSLVTNHVGLNSDEDTPERYILKYYDEAPEANKVDIKNKIGDLISYYSFKTIDNEGNSKYYYYIPTAVGDGADRMGAEGIYVDANGQRVDEDKIIAIDFNSRIYAIREAYRDANITGISKVGGLVGGLDNGAVIDTTYNAGSVTGNAVSVGAIAGEVANSAKIKNSFFVKGDDISTGKAFSKTDNRVGDSSKGGIIQTSVQGSEITNLRSGNEIKHVLDSSEAAKKFFDPQSMNDSKGNPIYQLKYGSDTHYLYLSENALNVDDPNSSMSSTAKKVVQGIQECMEALKVSKKEYDIYEDKDNSEQIFAIIRLQKKDEEGHVVKDENGKPEIVIKIFGLDQLKGTDTASGSPSTHPETKDDLLKAEYGLPVASGDIISNQGDTWTVYGGQTLPLLNIFMNNADIAREFEYDGTIHNLVTDDVSGVYGRADFLGGAGKNVYTKGYEEMSDNGLSSHYYLDNSNIWAPQHGLRVSPTASVVINPIGLNITVEGEKIYGMHMLQGYYVSVPIYNSLKELVRYDYYKIGTREGSTIEEHTSVKLPDLEKEFKVKIDGDKSNKDLWKEEDWREYNNKIKNAILNNHHYVVTMDGFVNSETIESSLGGLVNFVTNNTADNLSGSSFKAAFDDQKLGVADTNFTFKYTDENGNEVEKKYYNEDSGAYDLTGSLGGITARYNNYKINYEGYLKVDKASIAYTYDGERDYGAANEDGTHSWYINGIDTNSTALSVNGQLKDWDALKLLETNLIKAQIYEDGKIRSVTFEELRDEIGAIDVDVNGTYTFKLSTDRKIIDKDNKIVNIENFTINSDNFKISDRGNLIMMSSENDKINISANYNDNGTINSYTIKNIEDNTEQTIYVKETKAETVLYTDFTAGGDKNGADLYTNPLTTGSTITQKLLKAGALTYDPGSSQYLIKESAFDETGTSITGVNGAGNILTTITANGEEGKKHYYACNTSGDGVGFWIEKGAGDEPDKFYEYVTPEDYTNKKELSAESKLLLVNFGVINEDSITGNQKFNNAFYTQDGSSIESYAKEFVNKDTGGILLKNYSDDSYNNFTNYVVSDYTGKVISDLYQKTTENEITLYSDSDHKDEINSSNNTMQYIVGIGTANDLYHVLTKENNDGNRVVSDYTLSYLGTDFELVKTDDVSEQSFKTLQNTLSNYNFDWRMGGTYGMLSSRADQKAYGTTDITVKDSYETIKPIELEVNVSGSRDYLNTMKNDQFTVSNGGEGHTLVTSQDIKGDDITGAQNFTWNFDFGRVEGTGDDKHIVNGLTGDDNNRKETILSFDNVKALTEALEGDTVTITVDDKSEEVKRINANTFVKRGTDGTVTVYNLTKHDDNTEAASYKGSLFDVSQMFVVNSDTNLLEFNGKYYDVSHKDNDPAKELDTINTVFKYGNNLGILSNANKYDYLIKAPENNAYTLEVKPVQLSMDITVNGSRYYGQHTSQDFTDTNSYKVTAVDKTNSDTGAIKVIDGLYYVYDGEINPDTKKAKGWVKLADNIALQNNLGYDKDGNKLLDYGQKWNAGEYTNSKAEGVKLTDTYDKTTGKLVNVISIQEKDGYTNGIRGTVAKGDTGSNGSIANNYNISGLDATYEIKKADLYYTLAGYREYGEANETGIYRYELSGIDKNSGEESVNGFLKSFDVGSGAGKISLSKIGEKYNFALDADKFKRISGSSFDFTLEGNVKADTNTNVKWNDAKTSVEGYTLKSVSGIEFADSTLANNYNLVLLDKDTHNTGKFLATKVDGSGNVSQEPIAFANSVTENSGKSESALYITPVEVQLSVQGQRYYGNAMKEVTKSSNFTVNANASSLGNGIFNVTAQHKEDANTFLAALGVSENYTGTTTSSKINFWSSSSLQTAYGKEADDSYSIYKKLNSIENNGTDKSITNATKVKLDTDGNVTSYDISYNISDEAEVAGSKVNLAKNAGNYVFYDITGSSLTINKRKVYYTIDGSRTYGEENDTSIYNLSFRDPKGNTGFAAVDIANSDGKLTTDNIAVMKEALDITLGFDAYSSAGEYKSGEIISTKSKDSDEKITASVTAEYTDAFYGKGSKTEKPTMSVTGLNKMFSYDINGQSTGLKSTINMDNYEIIGTHNFDIAKRDIALATTATRTYGDELTKGNVSYEVTGIDGKIGLVNDDEVITTNMNTVEVGDLTALDAGKYTGTVNDTNSKIKTTFNSTNIATSDAFSNNYNIAEETYTLNVNQADLTIDITGSKTYGDGTYTTGDGYSFKISGLKNGETIADLSNNTDGLKGSKDISIDTTILLSGVKQGDTDANGNKEDNLSARDEAYTSSESKGVSISNLNTLSKGKDDATGVKTGFNANNYNITTTSSFTVGKKKLMYELSGVKTYGDTSTGAINWTAGLIDGYRLAHIDVGTTADLVSLGEAISTNIISSVKTDVDEGVTGSKKYVFADTYDGIKESSSIIKDEKPLYNVTTEHTDSNTENTFNISVEMNKDEFTNLIKNKSGNRVLCVDTTALYGQHILTVNKRDLELNTTAKRVYGDKGNLTDINYELADTVDTYDNTAITHDLNGAALSTILTTKDKDNTDNALDVKRDATNAVTAYVTNGENAEKYITTKLKDGVDNVFSNYNIVQNTNSLTVTPKNLTIEIIGTKTYGDADAENYHFRVDGLVNDEKIGAELGNYTGETGRTATDLHVSNTISDSDIEGYNSGSYLDAGKYTHDATNGGTKTHGGNLVIDSDKLFNDLSVGKDSADTVTAGFNANNYNITQKYQFTVTPKTLDMTISGSHTYGDTTVNTDSGQMITDGSHFYGAVKGNYTSGLTIDTPNDDPNLKTWLTNLGSTNAGFKASNYQLNKEHIFTKYTVDKAKLNVYIVGQKLYGEESGSSSNSSTKLTDNGLQYKFAIAGLKNDEQVGTGTSIDSEGLTADSIIAAMYNGAVGGHIANMDVINNAKDNDIDTNYNSGKFLNATVKHSADGSKEDTPYVKDADDKRTLNITVQANREYGALNDDGTNANKYSYTTSDIVGDEHAPDMLLFKEITSGAVTTDNSAWNLSTGTYGYNEGNTDKKSMALQQDTDGYFTSGEYLNTRWNNTEAITKLYDNYVIPTFTEKLVIDKAKLYINITGNKIYGLVHRQYSFDISGLAHKDGVWDTIGNFTDGTNLQDVNGVFYLTNNLKNASGRELISHTISSESGGTDTTIYQANLNYNPDGYSSDSDGNNLIKISNLASVFKSANGEALDKNYEIINSSFYNVAKRRVNIGVTATRDYGSHDLRDISCGIEEQNIDTSTGIMSFEYGYSDVMAGNLSTPAVTDNTSISLDVGTHSVTGSDLVAEFDYDDTNKDLGDTLLENYVVNKDSHVLHVNPVDLNVTIKGKKTYGGEASYEYTFSGLQNGETIAGIDNDAVYNTDIYLDVGNYTSDSVSILNKFDSVKISNWDGLSTTDSTSVAGFNAKNYNIITSYDFTVDKAKANINITGSKTYGEDTQSKGYTISLGLKNGETAGQSQWVSDVEVNTSEMFDDDIGSDGEGIAYNSGKYLDADKYDNKLGINASDVVDEINSKTELKNNDTGFKTSNYDFSTKTSEYIVNKKDLTIGITGNKTYGDATTYNMSGYSAEITGLVGDENINLLGNSSAVVTNEASDGKDGNGLRDTYLDAGIYKNTIKISDDVLNDNAQNTFKTSNYKITQNSVYTVGKKDMVLTTAGKRTYGVAAGKDVSTVNDGIVYSYSTDGLLADDVAVFEASKKSTNNTTVATTAAGKYGTENGGEQVLTTTINDNSAANSITKNYNIKAKDDFTIDKAKLSVAVEGNKVYGSDLVKYNINIDGLRNGETVGSDIVNNAVDSDIDGYNRGVFLDAGRYGDISAEDTHDSNSKLLNLTGLWKKDTGSGYDLNNYEVVSYRDQLNVAKASLSIDISGEKISGEETSAKFKDYDVTISGLQNGETILT